MEVKKFLSLYLLALVLGTLALKGKDLFFLINAESQVAKVAFHIPAGEETFYKTSGSYQEKMLGPVIQFQVNGKMREFNAPYSCIDGCHVIGSPLRIFYHKEDLSQVLLLTFHGFFKPLVYFYIFMMILGLFSIQHLYYVKQPSES